MKLNEKLNKAQFHLEALDDQSFDHLDFEWEGIHFNVAADEDLSGKGTLYLKATLGRLYFTIEDQNQRSMAIERLYSTNREIDGEYKINTNGDISFKNITHTESPLKGAALMSALTIIILEAENHLRALRSHLKPTQYNL